MMTNLKKISIYSIEVILAIIVWLFYDYKEYCQDPEENTILLVYASRFIFYLMLSFVKLSENRKYWIFIIINILTLIILVGLIFVQCKNLW